MTTTTRTRDQDDVTTTAAGIGSAWVLVARREVVVRLTDKAFLVGTAVTLLVIAGFSGFQAWDASRTTTSTLVVTAADRAVADRVADLAPEVDDSHVVEVDEAPDAASARASVADGEADAWLHRDGDGWVLTSESEEQGDLTALTREAVRSAALADQAAELGTTVEMLDAGSTVTVDLLRGDAERSRLASGVAFAFAFLFYVATLTFGITLANSVVEEKQSRIVEIIATSIPVRQLLVGKVAGNSAIAIAQMVLYAGMGLLGLAFTPYAAFVPSLGGPVAWFLVFFVAGFVALAALWAVAGALASRTEEVQSTSTPLTMLVLGVFFGALFADGTTATVLSYVPPFSAVVMPTRLLEGSASWWEGVVALGLLVGAAGAVLGVAERLYRRSLLQTGGKLSLRQAWSAPE